MTKTVSSNYRQTVKGKCPSPNTMWVWKLARLENRHQRSKWHLVWTSRSLNKNHLTYLSFRWTLTPEYNINMLQVLFNWMNSFLLPSKRVVHSLFFSKRKKKPDIFERNSIRKTFSNCPGVNRSMLIKNIGVCLGFLRQLVVTRNQWRNQL